MKENKE